MKLAIGMVIGLFYVVISYIAYHNSAAGWAAGSPDVGFWWAVIGSLLAIAALAAFIGSWLHTRPRS